MIKKYKIFIFQMYMMVNYNLIKVNKITMLVYHKSKLI